MLKRSRLKIEPLGTPESALSHSLKICLFYNTEIYLRGSSNDRKTTNATSKKVSLRP